MSPRFLRLPRDTYLMGVLSLTWLLVATTEDLAAHSCFPPGIPGVGVLWTTYIHTFALWEYQFPARYRKRRPTLREGVLAAVSPTTTRNWLTQGWCAFGQQERNSLSEEYNIAQSTPGRPFNATIDTINERRWAQQKPSMINQ